jgi:Rab11 family-interacting protein 3/4
MFSASDAELHTEISEISNQVNKIHQTLAALEEHQLDDRHVRLKQENAVLQERIHMLEESLHATEQRWKEKMRDERHRNKDLLVRVERERDLQCEALSLKLQLLEREHAECTTTRERLETDIATLQRANANQEERIGVLELQLNDLTQDHEDASGLLKSTRNRAQEQIRQREALIEELQEQVESLKALTANRRRSSSLFERSHELEEEVSSLRDEQRKLKEMNEELNAQLIQASVAEGRNLLQANAGGPSLAEEMDTMSKDQLMNALKDQEMVNQKLRTYIDGILLRIVEMYPAILEIKEGDEKLEKPS